MRTNDPYKIALRCWMIFPLVVVVLAIGGISVVVVMTRQALQTMQHDSDTALLLLLADVDGRAHLLARANATAFDIARVLSSIEDLSTFSNITEKVAPQLFLAFATMPWISQISYVGIHSKTLFSYYNDKNQMRAMLSNVSAASNDFAAHKLYSQLVHRDTGKVHGDPIPFTPQQNDCQWFQDALNGKSGNASWGLGWEKARDQMLFFTAPVARSGVISIGINMKHLANKISSINSRGGNLYVGTADGHVIAQTGPPYIHYVLGNDTVTIQVMDQNNLFTVAKLDNSSCQLDSHEGAGSGPSKTNYVSIWSKRYKIFCAYLDVSGIRMVHAIAFPSKGVIFLIEKMKIVVVLLLSLVILGVMVGNYIMLRLFRKLQIQEVLLRATLIKQKEAIQQTERKNMNKSLAFASASHDVRTSLAGITGLIELCRLDVPQNSKLDRHLEQMDACASKLLGIINSVLDASKIEAGKMQLEEVEFDMAQVLEESVDIFHVVALKKGLEVIWDPFDCSLLRCLNVKGDCRRIKQILDNLLSNAVKFTSEGHVVVRAWAKKPSLENFEISSKHKCHHLPSILDCLSKWLWKDGDDYTDPEILNPVQCGPNSIEFIFEIDDTGKGITKEKKASVFENYMQVKESTTGEHEGTGLGLGIVQSYVRLMGGEISIKDKEPGERGTCFRFNIFLKSSDTSGERGTCFRFNIFLKSSDTSLAGEGEENNFHPINTSVANAQHTEKNVTVQTFNRGLQMEGIHSLLLVQGKTKEILQRWMENLGVMVSAIEHWELLHPSLENIKNGLCAADKSESVSRWFSLSRTTSFNYNREHDGYSTSRYVPDQILPITTKQLMKKPSFIDPSGYILVVIDLSSGNISEICSILKHFTNSNHNMQWKIVWLASPNTPAADLSSFNQEKCDLILQKPLHGSRLYALLKLLQEFGGTNEDDPQEIQIMNTTQELQHSSELGSSTESDKVLSDSFASQSDQHTNQSFRLRCSIDNDTPLSGMDILLVEDSPILTKIVKHKLSRLGATIEHAENGLEAVNLVKKALRGTFEEHNGTAQPQGDLKPFPYDVILMDCEMPIMNGYEATRQIREEEKYYGLHISIIALTAHATSEEETKSILAGMDSHLTKPLKYNELLDAIKIADQNKTK